MAKRLAELGALQDAVSNDESSPKRLALAGYIRGLFLDWSANPYNPLSRLTARGRLLGYFWDSGAIGLSMNFADQNYLVKDGTVQSKSFSQIVNFSRTTNATVTNSAGQIAYAPHNLLTFSEQFDNAAWVKFNSSVTANTTVAPNETTTADTLNEGTATNVHQITQAFAFATATNYTLTIYAKYIDNPYIYLSATKYDSGNTYASAAFNIQTGTFVTSASLGTGYSVVGTPTITPAGNGWYRCSVTITFGTGSTTSNSAFFIYQGNTGTIGSFGGENYTGTNRTVYIWGAQLEIGSTATTYNSTTVKNLLGYSELFDNAAWTKSNSFMQTNLLTYSQDFSNAIWTKVVSTVTANSGIAPDGTNTATLLTVTNTSELHQERAFTAGANGTFSIWVKAASTGSAQRARITTNNTSSWNTGISQVITLTDQWQRIVLSGVLISSGTTVRVDITSYDASRTSDSTCVGNVLIWGAQLVQGSVAGDYRRTDAAALPIYYANHNGVVCAEKLVEDTASASEHRIYYQAPTLANSTYTLSIYAKKGERNILRFTFYLETVYFNLSNGTHSTPTSSSVSITPVGNDWYRCSMTYMPSVANPFISIALSNANNDYVYTGDGTSGIYIFGAQLSDSASLDPYVLNAAAAPTAAAYYGARFDYDPVTLLPKGLLIEEQRANLLVQSETLGTSWILSSAVLTENTSISPDGTQDADKLVANNSLAINTILLYQEVSSLSASTAYTGSIYLKASNQTSVTISMAARDSGGGLISRMNCTYNLSTVTANLYATGTFTNTSATITSVGNGWYRCTLTGTSPALTQRIRFELANAVLGDGASGFLAWGAQLEAGAFATSYIHTAASQVTRAADVATIQGSNFYSWYNQNEGSVYASIIPVGTLATNTRIAELSGGTANRVVDMYISGGQGAMFNGTTAISSGANLTLNTNYKIIGAYKTASYAVAANGNSAVTASSQVVNLASALYLGNFNDGTLKLNGTIKQISYYPQRLSDSVLKGLTA